MLEDLTKAMGEAVPHVERLVSAIGEAMDNVENHAYDKRSLGHKWWTAAGYNTNTGWAHVAVWDNGMGIPETMRGKLQRRAPALARFLIEKILKSEAGAIEAAHEMGRSQTGEQNRGKGLPCEMMGYISGVEEWHDGTAGIYRVTSGYGVYEVSKTAEGATNSTKRSLSAKIPGTLIEWIVTLQTGTGR